MAECEGCDGRGGLRTDDGYEFTSVKDISVMLRVSYNRFVRRVNKFRCKGLCKCEATKAAIEDIRSELRNSWKEKM